MTDTPFDPDNRERLGEGGTWLLDLVSVVDHFQRGYRPGFTVWDALDEAIRHTLDGTDPSDACRSIDPLLTSLRHLTEQPSTVPVAVTLQQAIRRWVVTMAHRCNNGGWWPHPQPRRSYPPPLVALDDPTGKSAWPDGGVVG